MAAEESNARDALRIIADSVAIHLLHLDRDERILFANAAAADGGEVRVTSETAAGTTFRVRFPVEDAS